MISVADDAKKWIIEKTVEIAATVHGLLRRALQRFVEDPIGGIDWLCTPSVQHSLRSTWRATSCSIVQYRLMAKRRWLDLN